MMRIALYTEDRELQLLFSEALGEKFQVHSEWDEDGIRRLVASENCDLVYLDLSSNTGSVAGRIRFSRQIALSPVSSAILADDSLQQAAIELVKMGADAYQRKSSFVRDLGSLVKRRCEHKLLKGYYHPPPQAATGSDSCCGMIGNSSQMQQVYDLIHRVADLDASVLITGESGTGKELIARSIHDTGLRSRRRFVAVSCSAIPETLLEAALFGHEKGAFTGTAGAREGYLEQVGSGTLFLDEIGDLSLQAQVKLLRVLQEREFSRLGSNRLIALDARIIFATHRDLAEMVKQGEFREDLYYRVNIIAVNAPPLREHPEDISDLAVHFFKHYSQAFHKPMKGIDTGALALLEAYTWPGNVRELENVIQRAIVLAEGDTVHEHDLPLSIEEHGVIGISSCHSTDTFERQISDYKIRLAKLAIQNNSGNKTVAARNLGISRAYLHRLIRAGEAGVLFEQDPVAVKKPSAALPELPKDVSVPRALAICR